MKSTVVVVVLLIASLDWRVQSRTTILSKQLPTRVRVKRWFGYGGFDDPFGDFGPFYGPYGGYSGFDPPYGRFGGYGGRFGRYGGRRYGRRYDDYDTCCS